MKKKLHLLSVPLAYQQLAILLVPVPHFRTIQKCFHVWISFASHSSL